MIIFLVRLPALTGNSLINEVSLSSSGEFDKGSSTANPIFVLEKGYRVRM